MKRHKSLHALSQHHHFALIQALFVKRAKKEPKDRRAAAVRRVAQNFLKFWESAGKVHFREEEEILLPAYAQHVRLDEDADVMRMLADHAEIRWRISRLGTLLATGASVETAIAELARMLNDHVRLEEDRIFPRIEKALGEAELAAIGPQLTRLHRKGETCEI